MSQPGLRFETADVTLAADAVGPADGRPVLLFHGGGQTRHSWGRAAGRLAARGFLAVAVDLRGHGESEWAPSGRYELEDHADDVARIARRFTRPVLVGASLGGLASLLAVSEQLGDAVAGLVLVDVAHRAEETGRQRIRGFMKSTLDGFRSLDEAADAVSAYLPGRPRPTDLSGLARNLRPGPDGRLVWHWDPRILGDDDDNRLLRNRARLVAAAQAVRVPTLVVRGAVSDIVSEEIYEELRALIPGARGVHVAGAGHMVAGDDNDVFTAALLGFLDEGGADSSTAA